MTRYLIGAAAVLLLSASPVLAADTMKPSSQPAGENAAGSDASSGAKEQSSAPPGGRRLKAIFPTNLQRELEAIPLAEPWSGVLRLQAHRPLSRRSRIPP